MKKLISVLISVLIVAGMVTVMPITSFAATDKTQAEAVEWAKSQIGKGLDYDGYYGVQCVDFIAYYYKALGTTTPGGNGCDYAYNRLPAGWQRITYYNGFTAQPGDIAVWTYTVGRDAKYGHVGVVTSANTMNLTVIDQRGSGHTNAGYSTYPYSSMKFYGVIRPDFKQNLNGTKTVSDGDYHIVSALNTSYGLNVAYNSKDNGKNVQLWNSMGEAETASLISARCLANGNYTLSFKNSGKVLDVQGGNTKSGTNVWQYVSNNTYAQQWIIKPTSDGYFNIISALSGKYLDVSGASVKQGTNIQVYDGNGTLAQKWRFIASGAPVGKTVSDGEYHISTAVNTAFGLNIYAAKTTSGTNIHIWDNMTETNTNAVVVVKYLNNGLYSLKFKHSQKMLDVSGGGCTSGTNVQQYNSNNTDAQKWIIKPASDGYFYIISKGSGLYLDVSGGIAKRNNNVQVFLGNGTNAQKWRFTASGLSVGKTVSNKNYHIRTSLGASYGVSAASNSKSTKANIQLSNKMTSAKTLITVKYVGNGFYTLKVKNSGLFLDVVGGGAYSGTNVWQYSSNGTDAQKWIIKPAGNGYYNIISKVNGMYLDVKGAVRSNGTNIWTYTNNGTKAQRWKFS